MRALLACVVLTACGPQPVTLHHHAGRTFTPFSPGTPPPIELADDADLDARDRYLADGARRLVDDTGATGAAWAVVRDGEIAYADGVGLTADDGAAVDADTPFRVGSVGKMFTALSAVRLASEGRLDLDAPVASYVSVFSDLDPAITMRTLLSHTAGIPDDGGCGEGLDTPTDYARAHVGDARWSPPGAFFNYSNAGFTYAGAVLEQVSGEDFDAVVEREVFATAGMESATYDPELARERGAAVAHRQDGSLADDEAPCGLVRAAGGAFVSARDLARFAIAMMDGTFDDAQVATMLAPRADTLGGDLEHYGLGVFLRTHGARVVAFHSGGMQGWAAIVSWIPEARFAFVFVVNANVPVPIRALDLYFPRTPEEVRAAQPPPLDDATLDAIAGTYVDPHGLIGRVRVERDGARLRLIPLEGQDPWPLVVGYTFWPNGAGTPRWLATRLGVAVREE
ncbi:MAG: serine hydrolase domain-containing protein [Sandaracinaceae bacterium]